MNAVVTALKEVDDQTAEMLRGIIRSLFEIARCKVKEELTATKKHDTDLKYEASRESRGSPAGSGSLSGCHCNPRIGSSSCSKASGQPSSGQTWMILRC